MILITLSIPSFFSHLSTYVFIKNIFPEQFNGVNGHIAQTAQKLSLENLLCMHIIYMAHNESYKLFCFIGYLEGSQLRTQFFSSGTM